MFLSISQLEREINVHISSKFGVALDADFLTHASPSKGVRNLNW
jgi:hypothetical protein